MANGFGNIARIPELRTRLLWTLGLLAIYRIGVFVTIPGVDRSVMERIMAQATGSFLGMFNMFSGGALEQLSIFALGIMPYISSSIILQLLTVVIPKLDQLKSTNFVQLSNEIRQPVDLSTPGRVAIESPAPSAPAVPGRTRHISIPRVGTRTTGSSHSRTASTPAYTTVTRIQRTTACAAQASFAVSGPPDCTPSYFPTVQRLAPNGSLPRQLTSLRGPRPATWDLAWMCSFLSFAILHAGMGCWL